MYINNGLAYIPVCNNVSTISFDIIEEGSFFKGFGTNKNCFNDIQIKYNKSGKNNTNFGFLRNQNIITQSSNRIECDSEDKIEMIINNEFKVTKYKNRLTLSNYSSSSTKLKTRNKNLKNLFEHHSYLTNGTDLIEDLDEFLEINNSDESFSDKESKNDQVTKIEYENNLGYFNNFIGGVVNFFSEIFTTGFNLLSLFIVILVAYFLLRIFLKCVPFLVNQIRSCIAKNKTQHEIDIV